MNDPKKIIDNVISNKITEPQLLYRDLDGNTLWIKYIKTRGRTQIFVKNADGQLVDEKGIGIMLGKSNIDLGEPISEKGKRINKYKSGIKRCKCK